MGRITRIWCKMWQNRKNENVFFKPKYDYSKSYETFILSISNNRIMVNFFFFFLNFSIKILQPILVKFEWLITCYILHYQTYF